jgi:hypothetical protein
MDIIAILSLQRAIISNFNTQQPWATYRRLVPKTFFCVRRFFSFNAIPHTPDFSPHIEECREEAVPPRPYFFY